MIFVDDLHLDFSNTARIKDLLKQISNELVHEGDMFGIEVKVNRPNLELRYRTK